MGTSGRIGDRLVVEDAVGALLALLAVPPLSTAAAWAVALFTDRRGDCVRCSRWPCHSPPEGTTTVGPAAGGAPHAA